MNFVFVGGGGGGGGGLNCRWLFKRGWVRGECIEFVAQCQKDVIIDHET